MAAVVQLHNCLRLSDSCGDSSVFFVALSN